MNPKRSHFFSSGKNENLPTFLGKGWDLGGMDIWVGLGLGEECPLRAALRERERIRPG